MGLFDTVLVPCPKCGEIVGFQSKSGNCDLGEFPLWDAPEDVMEDVNRHSPHVCKCGAELAVEGRVPILCPGAAALRKQEEGFLGWWDRRRKDYREL